MIASPSEADNAAQRCGDTVEVVALPIDDSWMRDTGPIVVRAADGQRQAMHFRFNAWGEKYTPYDADARVGAAVAHRLGLPVHEVPLVLEGGAIAVDGNGLLVTTERTLLNRNRNPNVPRAEIESVLERCLGVDRVVWLPNGIAEDDETDGHVDNVVAFFAPGRAILQGCDDTSNPNHAIAASKRPGSKSSRAQCCRTRRSTTRRSRSPMRTSTPRTALSSCRQPVTGRTPTRSH